MISFLVLILALNAQSFPSLNKQESQQEFIDPCSLVKCSHDEICIAKDDMNANCVKQDQVQTHHLSKRQVQSFCGTSECRFGECEIFNSTTFICHCTKGVSGENCNKLDTSGKPCSSNPCYGDSVCINLSNNYVCVCGPGRTGSECKSHLSPCQCKNEGVCISNPDGTFGCKCKTGFGGHLCEYSYTPFLSCQITGCLNDGICTISSKCSCPPLFTGLRCEVPITTTRSTTTTTIAPAHYNINVCYVGICQNGGTCYQLGTNFGICICAAGFSGPYCSNGMSIPNNKMLSFSTPVTKNLVIYRPSQSCPPSIPNPCQNKGVCSYSESTNTITCNCPPTYDGPFCNSRIPFCAKSPCKNGGKCNQTGLYEGNCTCPPNYTGLNCDISLTCDPNPCKNNQPCLVVGKVAKCFCAARYKPPFCDL